LPDGKTLASGSCGYAVRLWDSTTGAARGTLKGLPKRLRAVAFSPDGKTLACGLINEPIRLWDWTTGTDGKNTTKIHLILD
jgi:WD40 repeat protein